ncbi:hypothetical protein M0657_005240 [Pyricularia oryzae]|nr:hypothetical protein M9X92_004701 [Pyricularia oryzae]KAI7923278.1 hypothetical protein M0657_005240 [Pyricularia oryzae]
MIHPRVLRMLVPIMINRGKCAMRSSGLLCKVHRHQNATLLLPRSISVVLDNGRFRALHTPWESLLREKITNIPRKMRFFHIIVAALMATSGLAAPAPDGEVADTNTVADGKSENRLTGLFCRRGLCRHHKA